MRMISTIANVIGPWPYRMVLAGGWIDQPFVNRHNPYPPGAMVVISIEPICRFMDRSGLATSTRKVAEWIWPAGVPDGPVMESIEALYTAENEGKTAPSGSQDMAGLICPGISRLDYGCGAVFPQIESTVDDSLCQWLESVLWLIPVAPRPEGYDPLAIVSITPEGAARLGRNGRDCWEAIADRDLDGLGAALTEYEWSAIAILPCHLDHPCLTFEARQLWEAYATTYPGATYSGPGGGYLIVANDEPVPGAFQIRIRRGGDSS